MTVTRVGVAGLSYSSTDSSTTYTYGQNPTAGNLLTMGVSVSNGTTSTCGTPAGWNAGPAGSPSGSNKANIFTFWKFATGGDLGPVLPITGNGYGAGVVIEEWSGASAWDANSTVGTIVQSNATAAGFCTSGAVITTTPNTFIWSFAGFMCGDPARVSNWSVGGGTLSVPTYVPWNYIYLSTGIQNVGSAGTYTSRYDYSAGGGGMYSGAVASMAFKTEFSTSTVDTGTRSITEARAINAAFSAVDSGSRSVVDTSSKSIPVAAVGTGWGIPIT